MYLLRVIMAIINKRRFNKMRTYLINLIDIPSETADKKFFDKVRSHNFEWWRYFPLSFILLTPDNIYTNTLTSWLVECYGVIFFTVMEIDIKDIGGLYPAYEIKNDDVKNANNIPNPFTWFHIIKDPKFVPKWERVKKDSKESK